MALLSASNSFREHFSSQWNWDPTAALILALLMHLLFLGAFFGLPAFVFIWAERKVSGRIQDRLGPTRTGGRFGWLQSLADGIKLIQKEDLAPKAADQWLFRFSPYIVCASAFAAFLVLPFADGWAAQILDVGLFLILAIMSIEVVGIILAGYSSGSKWSLFGGMREAAQMVSYEVPMAICVLIPVVAVGTLNLNEIAQMQSGGLGSWLIFHDPFTFLGFFTYFTVATASCKRAPFDLAEAESELVGGFHTEYSGMRWSFFFLAEYASMFAVSAIAVILFLGGWHIGFDFGLVESLRGWQTDFIILGSTLGNYVANVIGVVVFVSKASLLVCVQIWVRWTLPRLRIDQVMTTCLKYLIPISCFLFLGAVLWPLILGLASGRTTIGKPMGERAARVEQTEQADDAAPETPSVAATPQGGGE